MRSDEMDGECEMVRWLEGGRKGVAGVQIYHVSCK